MPVILNSNNPNMDTSNIQHIGVLSYQGMMIRRNRGLGSKRMGILI